MSVNTLCVYCGGEPVAPAFTDRGAGYVCALLNPVALARGMFAHADAPVAVAGALRGFTAVVDDGHASDEAAELVIASAALALGRPVEAQVVALCGRLTTATTVQGRERDRAWHAEVAAVMCARASLTAVERDGPEAEVGLVQAVDRMVRALHPHAAPLLPEDCSSDHLAEHFGACARVTAAMLDDDDARGVRAVLVDDPWSEVGEVMRRFDFEPWRVIAARHGPHVHLVWPT